jgi:hypothetical protein
MRSLLLFLFISLKAYQIGGDSLIHKNKTKTPKSIESRRAPPRECDKTHKQAIPLW